MARDYYVARQSQGARLSGVSGAPLQALVCARRIRLRQLDVYAELHALSNFSFLRGASQPEELVAQAKALGYRGTGADR